MISVSGWQSVDINFFKMFRSGLFERFFFLKKKLERGVISAIKFEATRIHFSGDFFVVVVVVVA